MIKNLVSRVEVRDALLWWSASRLAIILIFITVAFAWPGRVVSNPFTLYDSHWYLDIATNGYSWNGDITVKQNVGFFPLLPIILRAFSVVIARIDVAGAILCNGLLLGSLLVLGNLKSMTLTRWQMNVFFGLLVFHPASVFLSIPYTEALFLFLLSAFFLCVERRWLAGACVVAMLCGLARANGWIVGGAYLACCYDQWQDTRETRRRAFVCASGFAGLGMFLLFCHLYLDDVVAPYHAQLAWGHQPMRLLQGIVSVTGKLIHHPDLMRVRILNDMVWLVGGFIVSIFTLGSTKLSRELRVFAFLTMAFLILALGGDQVRSALRYEMVIFPLAAQIAIWISGRKVALVGVAGVWLIYFVLFTGRLFLGEWVQ